MKNARLSSFSRYAWGILIFILAVIVWGGYVRASGSGAGCGSHWPLCNGEVLPGLGSGRAKMLIEFVHRVTSGLTLLCVGGLAVWGWKVFPSGHRARRYAFCSLFLVLTEALLGAGLVLLGLVDQDQSRLRVFSLGLHLTNTFLLIAAIVLTARWGELETGVGPELEVKQKARVQEWHPALGFAGLAIILMLGVSGAITALGDTLFPSGSLAQGFREDFSGTGHFLIQLRIVHPVLAILGSVFLIGLAYFLKNTAKNGRVESHANRVLLLHTIQLLLGAFNVLLLAPLAIQMVHLLFADLVWLNFILLVSAVWEGAQSDLGFQAFGSNRNILPL